MLHPCGRTGPSHDASMALAIPAAAFPAPTTTASPSGFDGKYRGRHRSGSPLATAARNKSRRNRLGSSFGVMVHLPKARLRSARQASVTVRSRTNRFGERRSGASGPWARFLLRHSDGVRTGGQENAHTPGSRERTHSERQRNRARSVRRPIKSEAISLLSRPQPT